MPTNHHDILTTNLIGRVALLSYIMDALHTKKGLL